jgi:hypothetical protein
MNNTTELDERLKITSLETRRGLITYRLTCTQCNEPVLFADGQLYFTCRCWSEK